MSAEKPIKLQILDHKNTWQELWWRMADGDITAYNAIKKLDVMEFWSFFDRWRARNKAEQDRIKNKK